MTHIRHIGRGTTLLVIGLAISCTTWAASEDLSFLLPSVLMFLDLPAFESANDVKFYALVPTEVAHLDEVGVMEIRATDGSGLSWSLSYSWPFPRAKSHNKGLLGQGWDGATYALRRDRPVPALAPGVYAMAWTVDGVRRSNVMPFRLARGYDYASEPLVKLIPVELAPDERYRVFGLRVYRHTRDDYAYTPIDLQAAVRIYNSKDRPPPCYGSIGHLDPLRPGEHYSDLVLLESFLLPNEVLSEGDTFSIRVRDRESPAVTIRLDPVLGTAWDKATTTRNRGPNKSLDSD